MDDPSRPVVRVARRFSASPERVFDAFLDPAVAGRFLFATDTGEMVRVNIDARVGGRFVITERRAGEDVEHTGEYLEIDRPRRLVFTFGVLKYDPRYDRVTIEIAPADDGCELTLTQVMQDYAAWGPQTQQGWTKIIDHLARVLGDGA